MAHDEPPSDVLSRLERAEELKLRGRHAEALVILEDLLGEDPENVAALEEVSDNELSLGRHARSETAAQQAIALDAGSYTGFYILGFLRSRDEKWEEAVLHLRKANLLKANNPEILRCLGWALFHAGTRAQGIVTLERSLNLEQDSLLTLCDLGVSYLELKNFAKARSLFLRALDLDPQNTRARECIRAMEQLQGILTAQQK